MNDPNVVKTTQTEGSLGENKTIRTGTLPGKGLPKYEPKFFDMSYREWLIGQALPAAFNYTALKYAEMTDAVETAAMIAIRTADLVCARLKAEAEGANE